MSEENEMKRIIFISSLMILMLFFTGCLNNSIEPSLTSFPITTNSSERILTPTNNIPTPTEYISTSTPPSINKAISQCFERIGYNQIQKDYGKVLFYIDGYQILDISTQNLQNLSDFIGMDPERGRLDLSPGGEYILYDTDIEFEIAKYQILDLETLQIIELPWVEYDWDSIWINSNTLFFRDRESEYAYIFNVNQQSRETIDLRHPDQIQISPADGFRNYIFDGFFISPTIDYGFYLNESLDKIFVWDIKQQVIAAEIQLDVPVLGAPRWALDGESIFFISDTKIREIYQVKLDGLITKLTNFSEMFEENHLFDFSISPDGAYLVFDMRLELTGITELYYLDINNNEIYSTCIQYDNPFGDSSIWSTNFYGYDYVLITIEEESENIDIYNKFLLVDFSNRRYIDLTEFGIFTWDSNVIGWWINN